MIVRKQENQSVQLKLLDGGDAFEFAATGAIYLVLKGVTSTKNKNGIIVANLLDGEMVEFDGETLVRKLDGEFVY